ncbi:TetR/AcrR family transcriptional regulator [Rhodoligotrophos defluvii]|uniref:TetR/AcrR family transcriptional regulator n=1 Tax=Rhodoligotrophos defluvii TaxID=2561934 RepID=UPI0010C9867C|nr:TetR/AcrR family transcriptional regulator [Rhodoligotrophos defluvii]
MARRIEEAVLDVFSTNDFHRATTRDIAARAKTSLSKLYALGSTKDEVFFHFVSRWVARVARVVDEGMASKPDAKERLRAAIHVEFAFYDHDPRLARALFLTLPRGVWIRDPSFNAPGFRQLLRTIELGRAEGTILKDMDMVNLADAVVGVMDRAILSWLYRGTPKKLSDKAPDVFHLAWRAISTEREDKMARPRAPRRNGRS